MICVLCHVAGSEVRSGITKTCRPRTPTLRAPTSWAFSSDTSWLSSNSPRQVCIDHSQLFAHCLCSFCGAFVHFICMYMSVFRFPAGLHAEWSNSKDCSVLLFSTLRRSLIPDFQGAQTASDSGDAVRHSVSAGWDRRRPWRGGPGQDI